MNTIGQIRSLLVLLLTTVVPSAMAYQVSPMFQLLEAVGNASTGSYDVNNTGDSEVTLVTTAYAVSFDANGNERLELEEEDFLILPPQAKVAAGESRRFRVRYLGNALLPQTKVYRLIFEQIQTTDESQDEGASVQFAVDFSTAIFVSPMNCKPKVNYRIQSDELVLFNPSSCVYDLNASRFELSNNSNSEEVMWNNFNVDFSGYLLPKTEKRVKLTGPYSGFTKVELMNPL